MVQAPVGGQTPGENGAEESAPNGSAGTPDAAQTGTEPDAAPNTSAIPDTSQDIPQQPEGPTDPGTDPGTSASPDASGDASTPGAESTPADAAPRSVRLRYQFPADLPEGTYSIFMRDADGEREVRGATASAELAGNIAEGDVTARGETVFIIRHDGEDYATVTPTP